MLEFQNVLEYVATCFSFFLNDIGDASPDLKGHGPGINGAISMSVASMQDNAGMFLMICNLFKQMICKNFPIFPFKACEVRMAPDAFTKSSSPARVLP